MNNIDDEKVKVKKVKDAVTQLNTLKCGFEAILHYFNLAKDLFKFHFTHFCFRSQVSKRR